MAENAFQARAAAHASLKETMRELERNQKKANPSMRLLKAKFEKVTEAKEFLLSKHFTYCEKAKKPHDDPEMLQWITPILDEANDLLDDVYLLLDADETTFENQRVQREMDAGNDERQEKIKNEISIAKKQSE